MHAQCMLNTSHLLACVGSSASSSRQALPESLCVGSALHCVMPMTGVVSLAVSTEGDAITEPAKSSGPLRRSSRSAARAKRASPYARPHISFGAAVTAAGEATTGEVVKNKLTARGSSSEKMPLHLRAMAQTPGSALVSALEGVTLRSASRSRTAPIASSFGSGSQVTAWQRMLHKPTDS